MDEAPADAALFEILKKAHWTALKIDLREKDFGYDFNLMPDTLYMVRMIYFFRPNHDLKLLKYNHLLYYPVLYRNSAWKFDSPEIQQYKFLKPNSSKALFPKLASRIEDLIGKEEVLEWRLDELI